MHGDIVLVGRSDHLVVALAAAGLDDGTHAGLWASTSRPSRKGKKASEAAAVPAIGSRAFSIASRQESTRLI